MSVEVSVKMQTSLSVCGAPEKLCPLLFFAAWRAPHLKVRLTGNELTHSGRCHTRLDPSPIPLAETRDTDESRCTTTHKRAEERTQIGREGCKNVRVNSHHSKKRKHFSSVSVYICTRVHDCVFVYVLCVCCSQLSRILHLAAK